MPSAQKHQSESQTFPNQAQASLAFKPQAMLVQALVKKKIYILKKKIKKKKKTKSNPRPNQPQLQGTVTLLKGAVDQKKY
jgi:hypothetical protein